MGNEDIRAFEECSRVLQQVTACGAHLPKGPRGHEGQAAECEPAACPGSAEGYTAILGCWCQKNSQQIKRGDDPFPISIFYIVFGILCTDFGSPNTGVQQRTTRVVRVRAPALWGEVEGPRHVQPADKTGPVASNRRPSVPMRLPNKGRHSDHSIAQWEDTGHKEKWEAQAGVRDFCNLKTAVHWLRLAREAVQDMSWGFQDW